MPLLQFSGYEMFLAYELTHFFLASSQCCAMKDSKAIQFELWNIRYGKLQTFLIFPIIVLVLLSDLSEMKIHRKVVIHPLKMSELSHPLLLEAIGKSSEFRTCFVQSVTDGRPTWSG